MLLLCSFFLFILKPSLMRTKGNSDIRYILHDMFPPEWEEVSIFLMRHRWGWFRTYGTRVWFPKGDLKGSAISPTVCFTFFGHCMQSYLSVCHICMKDYWFDLNINNSVSPSFHLFLADSLSRSLLNFVKGAYCSIFPFSFQIR